MLRYVVAAALTAVLAIVLYIPSVVPPERFLAVMKAEHATNQVVWGGEASERILRRMLDLQEVTPPLSEPPPAATQPNAGSAGEAAIAAQMAQASTRLFRNAYFRSIDTLMALATYRLSALLELAPLLGVFLVVAAVDGLVVRAVRNKEFVSNSAEAFGASAMVAIVLACIGTVGLFVPFALHPMHATGLSLAIVFMCSRALANYHMIR